MEGKERILREQRLYEASLGGTVESLNKLLEEDKLTLARVCTTCFAETPLHIAAMLDHLDFAKALLVHKPDLTKELDSHGFSPLHLASASGYVEMVIVLLEVNSDACLIRDVDGRTPLHLAVIKGHIHVIEELVRAKPEVAWYTLEGVESVLHLAVKHNRFEVVKLLVDFRKDDDVLNDKDNGNTILHIATSLKQIQTIKFLLSRTGMEVNAVNENGFTALDIIEYLPRDLKGMEIREFLQNVGALRAKNLPESVARIKHITSIRSKSHVKRDNDVKTDDDDSWTKKHESLMVAASVIAAMAYQAGLSPPSGVWDHDSNEDDQYKFLAGESVIATRHFGFYRNFWILNTLSFVSSLSILFLLVSGLPLKQKILMWMTLTSMAITYLCSMTSITPVSHGSSICTMAKITLLVWGCLIGLVILIQCIRFIIWSVQKVRKLQKKQHPRHANETQSEYQGNV